LGLNYGSSEKRVDLLYDGGYLSYFIKKNFETFEMGLGSKLRSRVDSGVARILK